MSAPLANSGRGPRQQFELSIGCVPLRLEMTDAQLFGAASARYAAFAGAAAQPVTIALNEGTAPEGPPSRRHRHSQRKSLPIYGQVGRGEEHGGIVVTGRKCPH